MTSRLRNQIPKQQLAMPPIQLAWIIACFLTMADWQRALVLLNTAINLWYDCWHWPLQMLCGKKTEKWTVWRATSASWYREKMCEEVLLTLYQTISRSLPSVLKLHLRVTVSPTTTGGSGSMVTVKYPAKKNKKEKKKKVDISFITVINKKWLFGGTWNTCFCVFFSVLLWEKNVGQQQRSRRESL